MMADPAYGERDPIRVKAVELLGSRTALFVPMLKDGTPIGVLVIWRREVQAFSESQIQLLSTFADQAVIALENVRLFTELEARNRELTEALEQQTATERDPAGHLQLADRSPAGDGRRGRERRPVVRCDGFRDLPPRRGVLRLVATHGLACPGALSIGATIAASRGSVAGRAVRERRTIHIDDFLALPETEFPETLERDRPLRVHGRTMLATPLLREGVPLGVIYMWRSEVQPFTDKQIALAKTFADQAVIAIENVRLFKELEGPESRPDRSPRAADGHARDPAGHLQLADRSPAGDGRRGRECRAISAARRMPRSGASTASSLRLVAPHGSAA